MHRKLAALVVAAAWTASLGGCGEVTTTDARKAFVVGLNADEGFPCTLTQISADMRKLKMDCADVSADDAASALAKACPSLDRLDMREVRITAGQDKRKCDVTDDCACQ